MSELRDLYLYLDGTMDAAARAAFEQRLRVDPALRAQLEEQQAIDASLRRQLAPPSAAELRPQPVRRQRIAGMVGIVAAAAVLVATAWWIVDGRDTSPPQVERQAVGQQWQSLYHDAQSKTVPMQTCETTNQISEFLGAKADNCQIAFQPSEPEMVLRGGCVDSSNADTRALQIAVPPSTDVLVFATPLSADPRPLLPEGTGLRLHRRVVGPFALYELSPLADDAVLESFTAARRDG